MKIFVTGSTGSIGPHLIKMLSQRGHTVHALVRSMEKAKNISFGNVVFFEGDITNKSSIDKAMQGCQQVYHLAAFAKVWSKDPNKFHEVNVQGTLNILEAALKHGVEKIVVTSTAGVFGPSLNGIITEETIRKIDFFNEYEETKSEADLKVRDFVKAHGLNAVIVSPTRVYGPFLFGEPSSITLVIDKFVNGSWRIYPGSGKETGSYVYIEDVALGHILAMEKGRKGETYLLGGENLDFISFYSILGEVAGIKRKMIRVPLWLQIGIAKFQLLMAETFGKEPDITPGWVSKGKYSWEVSPEKAIKELGLPITPIKIGLKNTIEYLKSVHPKK